MSASGELPPGSTDASDTTGLAAVYQAGTASSPMPIGPRTGRAEMGEAIIELYTATFMTPATNGTPNTRPSTSTYDTTSAGSVRRSHALNSSATAACVAAVTAATRNTSAR